MQPLKSLLATDLCRLFNGRLKRLTTYVCLTANTILTNLAIQVHVVLTISQRLGSPTETKLAATAINIDASKHASKPTH